MTTDQFGNSSLSHADTVRAARQLYESLWDAFHARQNYVAGMTLWANSHPGGPRFVDSREGGQAHEVMVETERRALELLMEVV